MASFLFQLVVWSRGPTTTKGKTPVLTHLMLLAPGLPVQATLGRASCKRCAMSCRDIKIHSANSMGTIRDCIIWLNPPTLCARPSTLEQARKRPGNAKLSPWMYLFRMCPRTMLIFGVSGPATGSAVQTQALQLSTTRLAHIAILS